MKTLKAELQLAKEEESERISELLKVLNKWPDEPALKELATVLELAKRAEELELESRADRGRLIYLTSLRQSGPPTVRSATASQSEFDSVLRELNRLLRKYRYVLELEANAGGLDRLLTPDMKYTSGRWEAQAVSWITDLARNRALSRLRRCRHCTKWIYAARSHQFYCDDSCRKKFASTADDFKRKRREYMAGYRANLKQRELSQLAAVRRKRR